jgi:hypothetical protein
LKNRAVPAAALVIFIAVALSSGPAFGRSVRGNDGPPACARHLDQLAFNPMDPSLRNYTPAQIQALMSFKPSPLLTSKEKSTFRAVLNDRDAHIREMEAALKGKKPKSYYTSMKELLRMSPTLKDTVKSAKKRLNDARDKLTNDFEPFGDEVKKWPLPARAEDEKLKKGREILDKFIKIDDGFFKYVQYRLSSTYEICIHDPDSFPLNTTYLETGLISARQIHDSYRKLLEALEKADKKAREAENGNR